MSEEIKALSIAIQAKVPVLIWGAPGTGKTSTIEALGEKLGLPVEVVIASIREPSDFSGLPIISGDSVKMAPPAWAKRLAEEGKGILFLDEISTAPPAVQAALLRVVLDRVVGDLPLPDGVSVIAAANPPEQAAGGWDLTPPLANRFCHIDWQINPREWVEGMMSGFSVKLPFILPVDWEKHLPQANALIASFVQHRPHLLFQYPKEESIAGRAWPSPRSWTMAARLLAAANSADADEETSAVLLSGMVGSGPALEFLAWKKGMDLPDPEDLLKHPDKFQLPLRGDQAFAVLSSVTAAALSNLTKERWLAAWKILAAAADQGGKDIAAVSAKSLAAVQNTKLPLPADQLREFIPVLKAGGLM